MRPLRENVSVQSLVLMGVPKKYTSKTMKDFKDYGSKELKDIKNFCTSYIKDINENF